MYNYLLLKQNKENCNIIENVTNNPVTYIDTNQLTCTTNKFSDSYIRQYFTKINFQNTLYSYNVELLSNLSLDIL